jgi:hypothetical protein
MDELRVPRLLGGALAAMTAAVISSFFGVAGTLIGAALMSVFVTVATAVYAHSLSRAHEVARRSVVRRAGGAAGPGEAGATEMGATEMGASQPDQSQPRAQPIRWQRVTVAAVLAFGIAVAGVTVVEAVADQPLASLLGDRSRDEGGTSVSVVLGGRKARPAKRSPSTTSSGAGPTTTAPSLAPTTTTPGSTGPTTTAPGGAPSTTAPGGEPTTTRRRR